MNKNILKISAALLLATSSLVGYSAKADSEILRDSVGVTTGVRIGTLGIGGEVAFPINDSSAIRANISYLPFLNKDLNSPDTTIKTAGTLTGSNLNGMALVDWHPFANAFRFSFGAAYNKFALEAKGVKLDLTKVDLSKIDSSSFQGLVDGLTQAIEKADPAGQNLVEAAGKLVVAFKESIKPSVGPINWKAELESRFSPVVGVGADNSTDPDASFIYGFDVAFMLMDTTLKTNADNSVFLNITDDGKQKIDDAKDSLTEGQKDFLDTLGKQASIGALGLKTFGSDAFLSSVFGGKTIVPVIMGHVAIPLQ